MLGKLIRHDMKAIGKFIIPVLISLICLTLVEKVAINIGFLNKYETARVLFLTLYLMYLALACAGIFIVIIVHFYRNLFGDEGYLMFTLPVKPRALVFSKLLAATLWSIISGIVIVASMAFVIIREINTKDAEYVINELLTLIQDNVDSHISVIVIIWVVALLVGYVVNIMRVYASIAIGQTFTKNKIAGSIIAYIVINLILSVCSSIAAIPFGFSVVRMADRAIFNYAFITMPLFILVANIVIGVALYLITDYMLNRKLNLE